MDSNFRWVLEERKISLADVKIYLPSIEFYPSDVFGWTFLFTSPDGGATISTDEAITGMTRLAALYRKAAKYHTELADILSSHDTADLMSAINRVRSLVDAKFALAEVIQKVSVGIAVTLSEYAEAVKRYTEEAESISKMDIKIAELASRTTPDDIEFPVIPIAYWTPALFRTQARREIIRSSLDAVKDIPGGEYYESDASGWFASHKYLLDFGNAQGWTIQEDNGDTGIFSLDDTPVATWERTTYNYNSDVAVYRLQVIRRCGVC